MKSSHLVTDLSVVIREVGSFLQYCIEGSPLIIESCFSLEGFGVEEFPCTSNSKTVHLSFNTTVHSYIP